HLEDNNTHSISSITSTLRRTGSRASSPPPSPARPCSAPRMRRATSHPPAAPAGHTVRCAPNEAASFNPPSGQTCLDFAADFVRETGRGYLMNPNATAACGYCPYADGTEYLHTLGISPDKKWREDAQSGVSR